jgi:hypothetical protein
VSLKQHAGAVGIAVLDFLRKRYSLTFIIAVLISALIFGLTIDRYFSTYRKYTSLSVKIALIQNNTVLWNAVNTVAP